MIRSTQRLGSFRTFAAHMWLLVGVCFTPYDLFGQTHAVITNVANVRALSAAEAAEARPIRLRAVVVDRSDPWEYAVVAADDTGGLYAVANANLFAAYHRGDLLELTGVSDPGGFAPMMKVSGVKQLGTSPVPPPRPVTYNELLTGGMDAQSVEISGVVHSLRQLDPGPFDQRMALAANGGLLHVIIREPQDARLAVDARVRLEAVCLYQYNEKRQFLNPVLAVPRGVPIIIETAAPTDPFAKPVFLADGLRLFSLKKSQGHSIHVRGVVTHSQYGSSVWIRDASSGLRLGLRSPESVHPGDLLDLVGFPQYNAAAPILSEVILRKLGTTNPPPPIPLSSPADAFDHEDDLVSLEATLTQVLPVSDGTVLTLESDNSVFKAVLKNPRAGVRPPRWQAGSRVRVAGICLVSYDQTEPLMGIWHPQSSELLLRSPDDVAVLQAPSWWTFNHIAYLLGACAAGLLLIVGLIALQGRWRLHEQRHHRAMAEVEFAAILTERNRMAREIHDTLAQGLVAISFRLRLARRLAVNATQALIGEIESAQEEASRNLMEARNSIWNMRSQVLETNDLPSAMRDILDHVANDSACRADFRVVGCSRRLAPVIENNLLRIGQEAIINAFRHAAAGQVKVQMDFGENQFRLSVTDDGCGFDVDKPPASSGGFGLLGMRERAEQMQATLEIHSAPGKGTEFLLCVPLQA